MIISSLIEIPESLHKLVSQFVETNNQWDYDQIVQSALESFLIKNKICTEAEIESNNAELEGLENGY